MPGPVSCSFNQEPIESLQKSENCYTAANTHHLPGVAQEGISGWISGSAWNSILWSILVACGYLLLGLLALSTSATTIGSISQDVFLAEGLALAAIILLGPRVAGGVFLGQFALAAFVGDLPILPSAALGVTSATVNVIGGWLFWRLEISPRFDRPRQIFAFLAMCAFILQPVSATCGVVIHHLQFPELESIAGVSWISWWSTNILGQILVVPFLLTWVAAPLERKLIRESLRAVAPSLLYMVPLFSYEFVEWGKLEALYRSVLFVTFHIPLLCIAINNRPRTVSLMALLLTVPFISFVNVGDLSSGVIWSPTKHFLGSLVIFSGVMIALIVSAIREQVVQRNAQLHDAISSREQLLAIIGHDLRGPVGVLKSCLDLLKDGDLSPEEFLDLVQELGKGVDHANDTLSNLMAWAEAERSSAAQEYAPVDLHKCVEEAMGLLVLSAERKEIVIRNLLPQNILVKGSDHQLQCVFRNLLSNALKFTHPQGDITVAADQDGDMWKIFVRDSGVGMKADRAARLFRATNEYRSTPGTANERGIGLGLQLCREFVEAHGGAIVAESRPGKGTSVCVSLPVHPAK